jgi:hypothetical protein
MILPNVRASFGRPEANFVLDLLERVDGRGPAGAAQLRDVGFDALLDDPRTLNAVMATGGISTAPAPLVFYILVRHALLEDGFDDRTLADYIAAILVEFGRAGRANQADREDGQTFHYLADIVEAMEVATGQRAFLLRTHLGNFALWLTGLFPDYITARVERRGAPGLSYYEAIGSTGYRLAADSGDAGDYGIEPVLRTCADSFPALRVALNRIADRYLFPRNGDSVDRLLRQVADRFRLDADRN